MINTHDFGSELKNLGYEMFSGVPCSYLKELINYSINNATYISAVNEGDAVAIAAGAYIGGKKVVVFMQNSGLSNAISPLSSLNYIFKIPLLCFVSLRGEPGQNDEPQHELMGQITTNLLDLLNINWEYLADNIEGAKQQLRKANLYIENNQSFFFIVKNDTFTDIPLNNLGRQKNDNKLIAESKTNDQLPSRNKVIETINSYKNKKTILLATTGKTGRELYQIDDSPNNFYMIGSMGCLSSFGLGLALSKANKDIIAIDGDGSILMRMGSLATIGYYKPSNMLHILLDNNSYESTGNQKSISENVDFVTVASACGYNNSKYVHNLKELGNYIDEWRKNKKLTFLYLRISTEAMNNLGRPKIKPYEQKERLQVFIND